jgi:hypothetical protein
LGADGIIHCILLPAQICRTKRLKEFEQACNFASFIIESGERHSYVSRTDFLAMSPKRSLSKSHSIVDIMYELFLDRRPNLITIFLSKISAPSLLSSEK